jgi:hypothetical protein
VSLPTDPKRRKDVPIVRGVLDYFPDAIAAVAEISRMGNEQHNPGQPLHWSRDKSSDHADCIGRHLIERGTIDTDGGRHSAKLAWRALALLQLELENAQSPAPKSDPAWDQFIQKLPIDSWEKARIKQAPGEVLLSLREEPIGWPTSAP